jgi:TatD DNase family protein
VYPNQAHVQSEDAIALIDTHCHLDCEPLSSRLPDVLAAAERAGVIGCVVPGVHPGGWARIERLCRDHAGIYPAFGIHPMHADLADDSALARLAEMAGAGCAIGEIGLDPHYTVSLEQQELAFREQLRLALSLGLPVLVHCRRAFQRTLRVLKEEKAAQVGGIMHAFSGSPEMAREFIRIGFAISLSGTVTWEHAVRPARLAGEIPLESLVLETDAPDLTPAPFRGQANQPAHLLEVLATVARIRCLPPIDLARASVANSRRIFRSLPVS